MKNVRDAVPVKIVQLRGMSLPDVAAVYIQGIAASRESLESGFNISSISHLGGQSLCARGYLEKQADGRGSLSKTVTSSLIACKSFISMVSLYSSSAFESFCF